MYHRALLVVGCGLLFGIALGLDLISQAAHSQEPVNQPAASELDELKRSASAFEAAFNSGDADAIAALFSENAEIVDEDGGIVQGRSKISHRFANLFKEFPRVRIAVEVTSLRTIAADVAVEDGISTTTFSADEPAARAPYSVIHVKRGNRWLIASVRDFPEESQSGASTLTAHDHLSQLEWLVGHWLDESPEGRVETKCRWSDDGNYLLQDYVVKTRRGVTMTGTQRIGWDPASRTVRSWVFDQSGAFAEATWTPVEDSWVLNVKGVTPDGRNASVTRVLTRISGEIYQVDSSNFLIGNELQPDTSVRVVRHPPEPAPAK